MHTGAEGSSVLEAIHMHKRRATSLGGLPHPMCATTSPVKKRGTISNYTQATGWQIVGLCILYHIVPKGAKLLRWLQCTSTVEKGGGPRRVVFV